MAIGIAVGVVLLVVIVVLVLRAAAGDNSGREGHIRWATEPPSAPAAEPRLQSEHDPDAVKRARFSEKAEREVAAPRAAVLQASALAEEDLLCRSFREEDRALHEAADQEFEAAVETTLGDKIDHSFYVTVAGTSHRNSDGTSRPDIIDRCEPFDALILKREPDNRFDPNAIAVCRFPTGEQLGYVDADTAVEISHDMGRHGERWLALFRHRNISPETNLTVGATILIVRVKCDDRGAVTAPR